jgi:hypothetical protein
MKNRYTDILIGFLLPAFIFVGDPVSLLLIQIVFLLGGHGPCQHWLRVFPVRNRGKRVRSLRLLVLNNYEILKSSPTEMTEFFARRFRTKGYHPWQI